MVDAKQTSDWQPIETVPKESVLLFINETPEAFMLVCNFETMSAVYDTITHWMPLPSKPKDIS